jgi:hypothetical protein
MGKVRSKKFFAHEQFNLRNRKKKEGKTKATAAAETIPRGISRSS